MTANHWKCGSANLFDEWCQNAPTVPSGRYYFMLSDDVRVCVSMTAEAIADELHPAETIDQPSLTEEMGAKIVAQSDRVILFERSERPLIDLKPQKRLTAAQYAVVEKTLKSPNQTVSIDELRRLYGDAVNLLKRLSPKPNWDEVIVLPGEPGLGYRIM